jgi:hypothetical protein
MPHRNTVFRHRAKLRHHAGVGERHHRGGGDADRGRATRVFDRGYGEPGWWTKLDVAACRIPGTSAETTRLKVNTPLAMIEKRPLPPAEGLLDPVVSGAGDHP